MEWLNTHGDVIWFFLLIGLFLYGLSAMPGERWLPRGRWARPNIPKPKESTTTST